MRTKSFASFIIPAAVALTALTFAPKETLAQYGGGYRRPIGQGGYAGHSRFGFRHRFHAYAGGHLGGLVIMNQAVGDQGVGFLGHGGGGGLFGGLRLSPFLSVEANWAISYHDETLGQSTYLDSIYLMSITADAKIHIPTRGPAEPYFQAGIGFAYIGASYGDGAPIDDSVFAKGPAFNVGGGVDLWLGPHFSVGGRVLYKGLYFNEAGGAADSSNFVSGVALDVLGAFHF